MADMTSCHEAQTGGHGWRDQLTALLLLAGCFRRLPTAPSSCRLTAPTLGLSLQVQLLLTMVTSKKDRAIATRLAMYREAIGCIPLALPRACLETHGFIGALLLHADDDLANMASRVIQPLAAQVTDACDPTACDPTAAPHLCIPQCSHALSMITRPAMLTSTRPGMPTPCTAHTPCR